MTCEVLLDSGTSSSLIDTESVENMKKNHGETKNWKTETSVFKTDVTSILEELRLPQFTTKRKIDFEFNFFKKGGDNDIFLGRDFATKFEISFNYKTKMFEWDGVEIPMVTRGHWNDQKIKEFYEECKINLAAKSNKKEILDAKYEKINVDEVIENQIHLNEKEKNLVRELLNRSKGTRRQWQGKPISLELIDGAKPYYAKPYKIPKAYEAVTKKELDRLVRIGLLNPIKTSEWAAPCFIIPKKDGTIRF